MFVSGLGVLPDKYQCEICGATGKHMRTYPPGPPGSDMPAGWTIPDTKSPFCFICPNAQCKKEAADQKGGD